MRKRVVARVVERLERDQPQALRRGGALAQVAARKRRAQVAVVADRAFDGDVPRMTSSRDAAPPGGPDPGVPAPALLTALPVGVCRGPGPGAAVRVDPDLVRLPVV